LDEVEELRARVAHLTAEVAELRQRVAALERHGSVEPIEPRPERLESRVGLTLVNRIGAITLAVGIIFFFKYAVDNRWIGATGRVILGMIAGLALVAAGDWLRRRGESAFSQGVCGCGLAILFVSLYAAFAYYHLLSQPMTFVSMVAGCAFAVALSFRFHSQGIAFLALIGGLSTPLLIAPHPEHVWLCFLYLMLIDAAGLWIALRKKWAAIVPMDALWAIIATAILLPREPAVLSTFALALAFVHFTAAYALRMRITLYETVYATAHGCLLTACIRELYRWAFRYADPAARSSFLSESVSVLLAVYALLMITAGVARRLALDRVIGLVLIGVVVFKLYLYDVWLLTRFYRISAFVGLGILLLAASYVYSRYRDKLEVLWSSEPER